MSEQRPLTLPESAHVEYSKNFVQTAVCELRFPVLLELETRPPDALQKALRREYPNYEKAHNVTLDLVGADRSTHVQHQLQSRDRKWTVIFRSSAVALECRGYTTFRDFRERLARVREVFTPVIDAEFFTRVGLRYINALPFRSGPELDGWLNPALAAPLISGPYGHVTTFWNQAQGPTELGGFSLRHGIAASDSATSKYIVDCDFFEENREVAEVDAVVERLHSLSYRFFTWAAGPKTLDAMGKA